jgi:hypothetical protein
MKDPKNIEVLNKLVMDYITLQGLQGKSLSENNPFAIYFSNVLINSLSPIHNVVFSLSGINFPPKEGELNIPSSMVHPMIKLAYDLYCNIDKIDDMVHPMMKEQIKYQLGYINFDNFIESSVESYKNSLFKLINNYNSNKPEYIDIKLKILNDEMQEAIEIEDYKMAAKMRDKILDIKNNKN